MPAHVTATTAPTAEPGGAWAGLSAAFTEQAEHLTGRDDLTVTCAPGAGQGSPGCFIPALATLELDGDNLGHAPAGCDPRRPSDRERYPALWGVFLHEIAHVRHSRRPAPGATATAQEQAAMLLEESRIEAAHLRRHPSDRRWLRASAGELVLADFTTGPTGAPEVGTTPWEAASAAALLLARVDAGVLDADETATLAAAITDVLGPSRLSALAALWNTAHVTSDDDHAAMLDLSRRWCAVLAATPDTPPPPPGGDDSGRPSPLAEAIAASLTAVARTDAPPSPVPTRKAAEREEDKAARRRAERAADRVFNSPHRGGHSDRGLTKVTRTRPPTPAEQAAARRLARILKHAAHRERVTTTTTSTTPPGRLRMRGARAADAQRAAGATPTAEPFTRTTRRRVPAPPLRLGIACDVSGSMRAYAAPVASAAWILARAAAHVPGAESASVVFGRHVRPITYPGRTPAQVREFAANDSTEKFREAVDALTAALDLTLPGTARLLVIVSDGIFCHDERIGGQERITRLIKSGCAVLWLTPNEDNPALNGAHRLTLTNPADAATAIGHAASRALRAT
jgi:hypothetical protein